LDDAVSLRWETAHKILSTLKELNQTWDSKNQRANADAMDEFGGHQKSVKKGRPGIESPL